MKKIFLGINLILLLSIIGFGQNQKKDPNEPADETTSKPAMKSETGQNEENALLQSGTSIDAMLQQTLDVKKAEVGDEVVLKITKSIKQNGEVVVPKGTKLIGRITEVKEKTRDQAMSKIGVIFDRLEGKNLNVPISATITSITNLKNSANAGDLVSSDISGNSSSSGSVSRGNTGSGGGLLGGVTNTAGGVLNTTTSTVGGVTNTTVNTVDGATRTLGRTVNGIQISQSANASAQGGTTLSSQNKNLRLEKGVMFQLQVNESIEK